jgi:hypothetical protein
MKVPIKLSSIDDTIREFELPEGAWFNFFGGTLAIEQPKVVETLERTVLVQASDNHGFREGRASRVTAGLEKGMIREIVLKTMRAHTGQWDTARLRQFITAVRPGDKQWMHDCNNRLQEAMNNMVAEGVVRFKHKHEKSEEHPKPMHRWYFITELGVAEALKMAMNDADSENDDTPAPDRPVSNGHDNPESQHAEHPGA